MLFFFFFNDTATTEIYTLSLHDALPIWVVAVRGQRGERVVDLQVVAAARHRNDDEPYEQRERRDREHGADRKSTRLNSSHANISYAVFCLKKKKNHKFSDVSLTYVTRDR